MSAIGTWRTSTRSWTNVRLGGERTSRLWTLDSDMICRHIVGE